MYLIWCISFLPDLTVSGQVKKRKHRTLPLYYNTSKFGIIPFFRAIHRHLIFKQSGGKTIWRLLHTTIRAIFPQGGFTSSLFSNHKTGIPPASSKLCLKLSRWGAKSSFIPILPKGEPSDQTASPEKPSIFRMTFAFVADMPSMFCPSTPLISRSSTPFYCMASICPARSGAASSAKATSRNLMATSPSCFIETMIAQLQKSSLHIAISRMMRYDI